MLRWGLLFILLVPLQVLASVWTTYRSWDESAEAEYAQWISQQGPDLFRKLNIATDCADAVIGARWIFARSRALPAANTLGDGKIFSNEASQFDSLPTTEDLKSDRRFLSALKKVLAETSTKTLYLDSYTVELNRRALAPGAFYLKPGEEMGHAELVARMDLSGLGFPITFFASTVPAKVRDLLVYPFLKVHAPDQDLRDGFRRLRWAEKTPTGIKLKNPQQMPWNSFEQYQLRTFFKPFDEYVFDRLGVSFDAGNKLQALAVALIDRFQARAQIVQEGFARCSQRASLCQPDTELFDAYSTYARDASLVFLIDGLNQLMNSGGDRAFHYQRDFAEIEKTDVVEIQGRRLKLSEILLIWRRAQYSSDPRDDEKIRWGLF